MKYDQRTSRLKRLTDFLWLGLFVTLGVGLTHAQQPPSPPPAKDVQPLTVGQTIERELAGGQTHEYQVQLKANEFVQVRVEQQGIDVVVSLHAADGRQLAEMDSPNGTEGFETLSWIVKKAGRYRFQVRRLEQARNTESGKYSITLKAQNAATAANRQRVHAEQQFLATVKIRLESANEIPALLKQYESLLAVWQQLNDEYLIGLINEQIAQFKKIQANFELDAKRKAAAERRRAKERAKANAPQLVVPTGNSSRVPSVTFAPDGKTLASGSEDKTIKLWDVATGQELRRLTGHANSVYLVAFAPDGKTLASGSLDDTIKLWEVATGRELRTLTGHTDYVYSVAFAPDGKTLASGSRDHAIKLWDVATGQELRTLTGHTDYVHSVMFAPDGKTLASGSRDDTIKLWDVATGQELRTLTGQDATVDSVTFAPDGKTLASVSNQLIKLWDVATGQELRTLTGHVYSLYSVAFSSDGKTLASAGVDKTIKLWDVATGQELKTLAGHADYLESIAFAPDGKTLASGSWKEIKLWDVATGQELRTLTSHAKDVFSVVFSSDGKTLASVNWDKTIKLWDVATGQKLKTLTDHASVWSVVFSSDGKTLASGGYDKTIKLWDVATGQELRTLTGHDGSTLSFSSDGKMLASGSEDKTIKLWDVATGQELKTLTGHAEWVGSVAFSSDGKTLASGSVDKTVKLWDVATGQELRTLTSHAASVESVVFSSDGKTLASGVHDKTIKLWDVATGQEISYQELPGWTNRLFVNLVTVNGKTIRADEEGNRIVLRDVATEDELATLVALDENDWVVADPDGRFDASPGAEKLLYYVVNTPQYGYETIDFSQLKERYYEPGLLAKVLGFNPERVRDVAAFNEVRLTPAVLPVAPAQPSDTNRSVKLTNRGGGIGRVQIFVNGAEFIEDARDDKLKQNPNLNEYTLSFDLKAASFINGQKPEVKIVAWNYDPTARERYKGYLSSRGTEILYTPPQTAPADPPELWAIIGGVSDYKGSEIDLHYAGKDAVDMCRAIEIGGKNLFGVEKLHLTCLSTDYGMPQQAPSKPNFQRAFADAAKNAKPTDIFFVYLSGHGITLGLEYDTYFYLTQEAGTANRQTLTADGALLQSTTISSEELTDWHKGVKAQKQVLILDTCAAGAFGKIAEQKDLPTDAIRAIDRMQGRRGFHVLLGSASDAVSYEATQYGQGLLTYSLLEGIKSGAALQDGQIDVVKLFQHAVDTVPDLAKGIGNGGIQVPEIRQPPEGDNKSFAVGLIRDADKAGVPLATLKPLVLRPRLQNRELDYDNLELEAPLRRLLREASYVNPRNGGGAPLVFVDTDEMPDALRPSGSYVVTGDTIKVTLRLIRNNQPVAAPITVEGSVNHKEALLQELVTAVRAAASKPK